MSRQATDCAYLDEVRARWQAILDRDPDEKTPDYPPPPEVARSICVADELGRVLICREALAP